MSPRETAFVLVVIGVLTFLLILYGESVRQNVSTPPPTPLPSSGVMPPH